MYLSMGKISRPNYSTPCFVWMRKTQEVEKKGPFIMVQKKDQSTNIIYHTKKEILYYQTSITYLTKERF